MERPEVPGSPNAPPELEAVLRSRQRTIGRAATDRARIEKITPYEGGVRVELFIAGKSRTAKFKTSRPREELRKVLPEDLVEVLLGDRKIDPADSHKVLQEIGTAYRQNVAELSEKSVNRGQVSR